MLGGVEKVVVTAAGLGTRLLPITKEIPKEMLPLPIKEGGEVVFKPMLQAIFEQLYEFGFRNFCFVVGRGKRTVEDYFTPDYEFLRYLRSKGKEKSAKLLEDFYEKISTSSVVFVNQPEPLGFGDAVYRAKPFVGSDSFLLHAGDDLVVSANCKHLELLLRTFEERGAEAAFFVEQVEDPRKYGVVVGRRVGEGVLAVEDVVEKPEKPPSNLAVVAVYALRPSIFDSLEKVEPDASGEKQLTSAIKMLLEEGRSVYAVDISGIGRRIDVGSPEHYFSVFLKAYEDFAETL